MPRYFFHLHNGMHIADLVGTELSGATEAKRHALRSAGALIAEADEEIWSTDWLMRVTNADNLTLYTLMLVAQDATVVRTRKPSAP